MTTSPCSGPACFLMSLAASSALPTSRQAITTRARSFSSSPARAFPIPQLAPVTMTVFPRMVSAGYWSSFATFCRGNKRRIRSSTPPPTTAATSTAVDMNAEDGVKASKGKISRWCGALCARYKSAPEVLLHRCVALAGSRYLYISWELHVIKCVFLHNEHIDLIKRVK